VKATRLLCVLGMAVALLVIGPTTPVDADTEHATHTGHGVVTVEARHPRPGNAIHYVVRLTWSADGHPATGAVVTAAPVSPSGVPSPTVRLTPLDSKGRYGGTIRFNTPGTWTITVSAGRPQTSAVIHERRG